MLRRFGQAFIAMAGIAISQASWGILIGSTDVGSVDTLIRTTSNLKELNLACPNGSSTAAETCWVNSVLGSINTFQVKADPQAYLASDTANVYGFYMPPPDSEYFIIKNSTWWALFRNLANLEWGVFNTSLLPSGMNLPSDPLVISHVTRLNPITRVPEPGSLALLGAGLLALGLVRRRKRI